MPTLFDDTARAALLARLDRLRPDSQRRWGTLSVGAMLAHMADQLGVGLGEVAAPPPGGPIRFFPLNAFVIRVMPWPHGRTPTHPVFLSTPASDFEADRAVVRERIERFAERGPDGAYAPHPVFGTLSAALWGHLAYRHTDYHLRQFGV